MILASRYFGLLVLSAVSGLLLSSCNSNSKLIDLEPDHYNYYLMNSGLEERDEHERFLGVELIEGSNDYIVTLISVSDTSKQREETHWDLRIVEGRNNYYIFSKKAKMYLATSRDSLILVNQDDRHVWNINEERSELEIFNNSYIFWNRFLGPEDGIISVSNDIRDTDRKWKYQIATDKELPFK